MATNLIYNGIDVGEIKTNNIITNPVYDPSGRDILFYQHTLDLQSIVYVSDDFTQQNPEIGQIKNNATELMNYLHHRLMEPRKAMQFSVNGEVLFQTQPIRPDAVLGTVPQFPADSQLDANYGPTPLTCSINQLFAGSYIINYRISYADGTCDGQLTKSYSSNRFSTNVKFDQSGYKTVTYTGKLIVNSDMRVNPSLLANAIAPPVPNDYARTGLFELSEDGLTLSYVLTDKQFDTLPPFGAKEAEGTFKITSQPPGAIMYGEVSVRLRGAPGTSRAELLKLAILICLDKLEKSGAKTLKDANGNILPPIAGCTFQEQLYDSEVSVSMTAMLYNNKAVIEGGPGFFERAGNWLGDKILYGFLGPLIPLQYLIDATGVADNDPGNGIQESIQKAKQSGQDMAASPEAKTKQVQSQLAAFGSLPVGSARNTYRINEVTLTGTPFEQMIISRFLTPCTESSGGGRFSSQLSGNSLQVGGIGEATLGSAISEGSAIGSSVNQPQRQSLSQPSRGGSALGRGRDILNTPVPVGPVNATNRAFLAIGDAVAEGFEGRGPIGEAVSIISQGGTETSLDDNELPGLYSDYQFSIVDVGGGSRITSRSTSSDGQTLVISFGRPTKGLVLVWSATKVGFPPEIPTLADSDQFTYIKHSIDFQNMNIAADNKTPVFSMSGKIYYEYSGDKEYEVTAPPPPWISLGKQQFINVVSSKTDSIAIADA